MIGMNGEGRVVQLVMYTTGEGVLYSRLPSLDSKHLVDINKQLKVQFRFWWTEQR